MFITSFFAWWYGQGWASVNSEIIKRLKGIFDYFSVNQLLRTLFSPWKRIITYPGRSLEDKLKAAADNIFSRVVGFVVRLFVLLFALFLTLITLVLSILELVIWPLLPPAVVIFLIIGII